MPRVPYSPIPEERIGNANIPKLSVPFMPEAFGAASAQALGNVGRQVAASGDEIFARALEMQKLASDAEAKEADAEYIIGAGKLHAEYNSLRGKAAVDAYPKYQEDLQTLREEIGGRLSNEYARKLYNASSRSTMSRTVFNGAGHAASENKRFAIGASQARVDAFGDQALAQPNDDIAFQKSLRAVEAEVDSQADLNGWGPDQRTQARADKVSDLWAKRIEGMAKGAPFQAKKVLDKAVADGALRGEQIAKTTNFVRQQLYTVGARNISHDISTGTDMPGAKVVPIASAKAAIGGFESNNNYAALGVEVPGRGRALGKYQVMPENLQPWLKESGLPPMTEQEFLRNGPAQEKVFETIFGGYMQKHGSFNEAASLWFSGKTMAEAGGRSDANKTTVPGYIRQTNAILARNLPLGDKVERARAQAEAISPDDSLFQDYAANRVTSDHNQTLAIKRNETYLNQQTVESGLMGGDNGRIPTNLDELKMASPQAEQAWNNLDPVQQRRYLNVLARNAKGDVAWNDVKLRRYQALKGQAASDPAEFLGVDVVSEDLPMSARKELVGVQQKLRSNAEGDPRVTKALGVLGPELAAAGVDRVKDKDGYYQFVGSLQDAITDWQKENQRAPKAQEVREIGMRLLQQQSTSWWLNPWSKTPVFQVPVPAPDAERIKADPRWREIGVVPTDAQIQRVYTRDLYQKLYGGKTLDASKPPAPTPPTSK